MTLITITRRLAGQLRVVFRQALNRWSRGPVPAISFATGPDGMRARATSGDAAVEYHAAGDHPVEQIAVPFPMLGDCEARKDDLVQLEVQKDGRVLAQWHDGSVPQMVQYDAAEPVDGAAFPRLPERLAENPPGILTALRDASETTDPDSTRYALFCIQLQGASGRLVATDGRQLLVQSGFQFPWEEDVLVSKSRVFGCRELFQDEPVRIGKTDKWFALAVGPWSVFLRLNEGGRFPDVEHHVPRVDTAVARFQVSASDAEVLAKSLVRLPGDDEYNLPVTVDPNGQVAIRGQAADQQHPTALVLRASNASGEPVRLNMNRKHLARTLKLGFSEVHVFGNNVPVLCRDDHRQYVWALCGTQHKAQIQTEVRDAEAVRAACRRLGLAEPVQGTTKLFSGEATGLAVKLPGWEYPVVADLASGTLRYDDFGGRWGDSAHLDRFLQQYAVAKTRIEARRQGHTVTEQRLPDGSIKLTVQVSGGAA